jgi:hypothetical protein
MCITLSYAFLLTFSNPYFTLELLENEIKAAKSAGVSRNLDKELKMLVVATKQMILFDEKRLKTKLDSGAKPDDESVYFLRRKIYDMKKSVNAYEKRRQ